MTEVEMESGSMFTLKPMLLRATPGTEGTGTEVKRCALSLGNFYRIAKTLQSHGQYRSASIYGKAVSQ